MDEGRIDIPLTFRGLDADVEVRSYRRGLPHWRQDGATYFVTFRLADSLPESVLRELEIERLNFWERVRRLGLHGDTLRAAAADFAKSFGRLLDRNLDAGRGSCLMRTPQLSKLVVDALGHFHGARYEMFAAVVMPNHCHLLVRPLADWALEDLLESWKGFTARMINRVAGRTGKVWQAESYDRIVRDEGHYRKVVRYIRANPVKAGLRSGEYRTWEPGVGEDVEWGS